MIFLFWGAALLEIHTDQGPRLVAAAALAASITTSNSNTSFRLVLFIYFGNKITIILGNLFILVSIAVSFVTG